MTQDELDQTLEEFKEQFGDKPRFDMMISLIFFAKDVNSS